MNLDFWNKVAHFDGGGSGPTWLSGWITAFCVFNEQGGWQGNAFSENTEDAKDPAHLSASQFASVYLRQASGSKPYLTLDRFPYPHIDSNDVPCGYTHVDVVLDDNGTKFDTMFVAGLIGSHISTGTRDTIQPIPGWWYFIKGSESGDEHRDNSTLSIPRDSYSPRGEPTEMIHSEEPKRSNAISSVKSFFDKLRRKY